MPRQKPGARPERHRGREELSHAHPKLQVSREALSHDLSRSWTLSFFLLRFVLHRCQA